MTTTAPPPTSTRQNRPGAARRRGMSVRSRRALLTVHIACAGTWIGIDVLAAVSVAVGRLRGGSVHAAVDRALADYFLVPIVEAALVAGLACLVTGVVLGLGTKWGLLRYWWVALKLAINITLCAILAAVTGPVGELARGTKPAGAAGAVFVLALAAISVLLLAMTLSVFKPFGRIRRTNVPAR